MDVPPLPFDVIFLIMEVAPPRTIAAMMRACRTVYRGAAGPRLLLRDGVSLDSTKYIISFTQFICVDYPDRFQYLHTLVLSGGDFSDEAVGELYLVTTSAFYRASTLVLHDAEKVLRSGAGENDPTTRLLEAFSRLKTLKHVTMEGLDVRAHMLLQQLPPGLVSATLAFDSPSAQWGPLAHPNHRNPIVQLANSADTLEELCGSGFEVHPDHVGYDVVYPRVRRICASYVGHGMPATAAYVHTFPNLERLALTAARRERDGAEGFANPFVARELCARRTANRNDQVDLGSWHSLRVVEGGVADVFALGLLCHVPELCLQGDITKPMVEYLEEVLDDVRPEALSLTIVGGFMFHQQRGAMARLLAKPLAQCLHSLDMEICFAPNEGDADMEQVLEDIFRALTPLPLRTLTLTLNYSLLTEPNREPTQKPHPRRWYFCPAERYLENTDLEQYASRFRAAMPSQESVAVRFSYHRQPHEHLLGPQGDGGDDSERSSDESDVDNTLAELGFGGRHTDEDDTW